MKHPCVKMKSLILVLVLCMISVADVTAQKFAPNELSKQAASRLGRWKNIFHQWNHLGKITIDSVAVQKKSIRLFFSTPVSHIPMRQDDVELLENSVKDVLGEEFKEYKLSFFSFGYELNSLIPNAYRNGVARDVGRMSQHGHRIPVVRKGDGFTSQQALCQNNIALWHSHGWYFEGSLNRWEWQRARLFGTVEDIGPMGYVLPYLAPMLENAGASVFIPRERDIQVHEVIVDNDGSSGSSQWIVGDVTVLKENSSGFLALDTLMGDVNPFLSGSSMHFLSKSSAPTLTCIPQIPQKGQYAVYISYPFHKKNGTDIRYDVHHLGGVSSFYVNQTIGCGTWIYLGTFLFDLGKNVEQGCVKVYGSKNRKSVVSADAVRFGGGMGNVARKPSSKITANQLSAGDRGLVEFHDKSTNPDDFAWQLSQKPRYMEGARYFLQYAGVPASIYNPNKSTNDYNDDYMCRGDWVNYLKNSPTGKNPGLGIPIDLSFAFHTDAGITPNDSVIGTLAIFSTVRNGGRFIHKQSKLASRDLADIIQTQIVDDIRSLFDTNWTRRGMWDKQYSEAWRPDVPTMLLELLSHQNLADMRFGLDPRFRFHVSRAIYKGMLRFLATQQGRNYVVQPLPVGHMAIQRTGTHRVKVSWKPVEDSLEPSAKPTHYKIYTRKDNGAFDNGQLVSETSWEGIVEPGVIYGFKVTAVNDGGEGFPSEIVSTGFVDDHGPIALVVNAFNRVEGPAFIDENSFAGIRWWEDAGVPHSRDISFTGWQYDYNRKSEWLDDDSPGWGASHGNHEGTIIAGNNFDFPFVHGQSLMNNGYSFVSVGRAAFEDKEYSPDEFALIDVILGEEKRTPRLNDPETMEFGIYTPDFVAKIKQLANQKHNLLLTGAYVGTDLVATGDTALINFAAKNLFFKWRTNQASRSGEVVPVYDNSTLFNGRYAINTVLGQSIYAVESPDGIEPAGHMAKTIFRYGDNNVSAAVAGRNGHSAVVLGFPIETVLGQNERDELMRDILLFFENKSEINKK